MKMKVILEEDIIRAIGNHNGVEVGPLPKGVGWERLRFDGQKVVDLASLGKIWVRHKGGGFFELHAIQVPGSQLVAMTYADRKNLTIDPDGTIRVKTAQELAADVAQATSAQRDANMLQALLTDAGNLLQLQLYILKLLYVLVFFSRNPTNATLQAFLDAIIPHVKDTFPANANNRDQLIALSDKIHDLVAKYGP
jgi:hypothetical protein